MSDDLGGGTGYFRFSSRTFREAALVALIPALGYAVAYAFALGRANDLGIPDQLIAVSLPDVFRSFAAVTAPLYIVFMLLTVVSQRAATSFMQRLSAFRVPIVLELISIVYLKAAQANWHWWAWILGIESAYLALLVGFAMLEAIKGEGPFRKKLSRVASTPSTSPTTVFDSIFTRLGFEAFLASFVIAGILLLSYASGWGSAANQQIYFRDPGSRAVLVAVDGSNFVFESYSGHKLTGAFTLVPSSSSLEMKAAKIGPLNTPKLCSPTAC